MAENRSSSVRVLTAEEMAKQKEYEKLCARLLEERFGEERSLLALVHSYGCQQNTSDGEKLMGMLAEMGFGFTENPADADLILYNTCAVRENAEVKVFGNVGELSHLKKSRPEILIGLCGCMMQQQHIAAKVKKSYPQVDFVFGTHALPQFPEILANTLQSGKRTFEIEDSAGVIAEGIPVHRMPGVKASLPIMYGCNNFCTYCVVPLVRGRERSRRSADVLREAREIADAGFREITLLGQNVNSYGNDLSDDLHFPQLLRAVNEIPGDFWVRFLSSHPKDCTKELIDTIAECPKVCNHIYLPVQSGSNRVLRLMNRNYTVEWYKELIAYARERIPGVMFTTDLIVGFPGETEEDFMQTLDLVKEVRFASLFTFIYSKRVGTRAAEMEDPVPKAEKSRWFSLLLDTQREIGAEHYRKMVGKTYRVLADGKSPIGLAGRTEFNAVIDFPGEESLIGRFLQVEVTSADKHDLTGVIRAVE
ncbi:MAG: tRNA (N6-isopentenyl adenosine(37)-C2)-methylthiotransferase MiaB [Candidatus Merdivicinus sp.]